MFSGFIWIILTIVICAAFYKAGSRSGAFAGGGAGKGVMIIFDICIIGGAVLGLLTGYVLFYRGASF